MKKIILLTLALAMLLCACGKGDGDPVWAETDITADELAQVIITETGRELSSVQYINGSYDTAAVVGYVEGYYGLSSEMWEQCAIYRASAADDAYEISVFRLSDKADLSSIFNELEKYRHGRQGDFFGYNPKQSDIIDDSIISISSDGAWAAVLICETAEKADEAFFTRLGMSLPEEDEPEETPTQTVSAPGEYPDYWLPYIDPEIDDMTLWDNSAVVNALKSGDDSGLDKNGQKLYKEAKKVLDKCVSGNMSAIEKEKAIYDWLCSNCSYDQRHYNVPNNAPRSSYEPYGAIVDGKAVCLGYATAFQLFMDALDIECITVVGSAFRSKEDHAWNMVKIDGEWYCVDATWDAGCGSEWYSYFNVSSDYMALTGHQWEYDKYPLSVSEGDGKWADEIWVPVE